LDLGHVQLIVVLTLLILILAAWGRAANDAWRSVSEIEGLKFETEWRWQGRGRLVIGHLYGLVDGRSVNVQERHDVIWTTVYSVSYATDERINLRLFPVDRIPWKRKAHDKLALIALGEPEFDARYEILADSSELVHRLLGTDAPLRSRLLARRSLELTISAGEVTYEVRGRMRNAKNVQNVLSMLYALAAHVET